MSENTEAPTIVEIYGTKLPVTITQRTVKPSKKKAAEGATERVVLKFTPVFDAKNVAAFTGALIAAAEAKTPGSGITWFEKTMSSDFEDATTEALQKAVDGNIDETEWAAALLDTIGDNKLNSLKAINDRLNEITNAYVEAMQVATSAMNSARKGKTDQEKTKIGDDIAKAAGYKDLDQLTTHCATLSNEREDIVARRDAAEKRKADAAAKKAADKAAKEAAAAAAAPAPAPAAA